MTAPDLTTIAGIRAALANRDISCAELIDRQLGVIAAAGDLNCFVTLCEESARREARAADDHLATGQAGPLTGIPIAHKDIFCTEGVLTTCASRMLHNFVAPYDAHVVTQLRAAGTVCLGKTNMDEFAMGSSNENSYYGPVRNPWDPARVPGGSSGGSAAAVAAGLVPAATGTDTGGSIRQPAAFCGVTGIKPTYGRVSRFGMIAFASSLDQGGVFARTARDAAEVLQAMAGFDERDSTSSPEAVGDYSANMTTDLAGLTVGVPRQYVEDLGDDVAAIIGEVSRHYEQSGARIVEVDLPHTRYAIPAYYVLASAECSANLARYDGVRFGHRCENPRDLQDLFRRSRSEAFGDEVKRRILTGTFALSVGYFDAYYGQAQRVRRLVRDDFLAAFESVDVLLTPTTPGPAFELAALQDDPVAMYQQDVYTVPASLAGLPGLSMPAGEAGGLPLGVQLLGPHFREDLLLGLANHWQTVTDWHQRQPPWNSAANIEAPNE